MHLIRRDAERGDGERPFGPDGRQRLRGGDRWADAQRDGDAGFRCERCTSTAGSQTLGGTGTVVFSNQATPGAGRQRRQHDADHRGGHHDLRGQYPGLGDRLRQLPVRGGGSNTSIVNQGTISADTSAPAIIVNPNGTFTNEGTLSASNGGTLYVNGLTGNVGAAVVSRSGSSLSLNGSNYVVDQGAFGPRGDDAFVQRDVDELSTITASERHAEPGRSVQFSTNGWSNAGTITATNSTVNLGGLFTSAWLRHVQLHG